MNSRQRVPFFLNYKIYAPVLWTIFSYFLLRYYRLDYPFYTAGLFGLVTLLFSILVFRLTKRILFRKPVSEVKVVWLITVAGMLLLAMSFVHTVLILLLHRIFLPVLVKWFFMNQYGVSILLFAFFLILGVTVSLYKQNYHDQQTKQLIIKEKLHAELNYLKNQINPHFLFNIHNSIFFLINEDPSLASKAVLKLSEIMRYQLYECGSDFVDLKKELYNISNYIDLEKIRMGNKVSVNYAFPDETLDVQIPPFLLLPIIDNAFKHISYFKDQPNFIEVSSSFNTEYFFLDVINTTETVAVPPDTLASGGIGLQNLKRRLDLLFPGQHEFYYARKDNVFSSKLKVRL